MAQRAFEKSFELIVVPHLSSLLVTINPTGKLVCQAAAAGVWREFSQGAEQKNNLVGFLHCLFGIQTLHGQVHYLWLFL